MHILLLDSNTESARELHLKLLSYKGIYWDLEHFTSAEEATSATLREAYDIAVVRLRGNESIEGELQNFVECSRTLPTVALIDSGPANLETQWIALGFADVMAAENISAEWLMRRMRIAIARMERQEQDLVHAQSRLQLAKITRGGSGCGDSGYGGGHADSEQEAAAESIYWPQVSKEILSNGKIHVAILRAPGTARLLEGIDSEVTVELFRDIKSYKRSIDSEPTKFDLTIIEQEFFEREGHRILDLDQLRFPAPPLILVTSDRSDASAVSLVSDGFDDCVPARTSTTNSLLRSARLSLARWDYQRLQVQQAISSAPTAPDRRQAERGRDRRVGSRYLVTKPLLAIPVLADGSPDRANIRDAFSIDFAAGGLGFQISNHNGIPSRNWIVGVETDLRDGTGERFHYCHVVVRNVSYPPGAVRMGAQFQPPNQDMLHLDNLMPTLSRKSGRFESRLSSHALGQWMELGVLQPKLLHRVLTCPECRAVATTGRGCHDCGSPDIRFQELIHHFACANVDDATSFERQGQLCCPKCLAKSLVIGVDFEIIQSHYHCTDCDYQGSQIADVSTCLNCRLRFPKTLAVEEEVYGYDVNRLDILVLLNSTN